MPIRVLDWDAVLGHRVRVYRNLNNHKISVQAKRGAGWIVVGHVTELVLADTSFYVSAASQARARNANTRNVHAWATGWLVAELDPSIEAPISLKYNYKTDNSFVDRQTGKALSACRYLVVRQNCVFVSADALQEPVAPKLTQLKLKPLNVKPCRFGLSLGVA